MSVLKVLVVAYVLTIIVLLMLAFVLYKFGIGREKLQIAVVVVYIVVNIITGMLMAKRVQNKKFLWGAMTGGLYFAVLSIVSFIVTQAFYQNKTSAIIACLACTISGMIGGMISK